MSEDEKRPDDDMSPDVNSARPSEFNMDDADSRNPYDEFLDEIPTQQSPADGKSSYAAQALADDAPVEDKNVPADDGKKFTTEEDIDIPDFLQVDKDSSINSADNAAGEDDFKSSLAHSAFQGETQREADSYSQNIPQDNSDGDGGYSTANDSSEVRPFSAAGGDDGQQGEEDDTPAGGSTDDKVEEVVSFEKKMSASDAEGSRPRGPKPKVLNKKFILTVVICGLGGIFLFTFLMPAGSEKKAGKSEKPTAQANYRSTDYASIANRRVPVEETPPVEEDDDDDIPSILDEVKDEEVKKPYTENNITYSNAGNSGTKIQIPDTRNDSLQAKSISGIKGLTSSQQAYQTDYQQTIAKNTSANASNRYSSTGSNFTMPSKEEFVNNTLNAYSQAYGNATAANNAYAVQNDQAGKNSFFNDGRNGDGVGQGEYLNLNTLWQGTIFEAVLTSELNTDLPGEITARIAKNVYSSQDGRYLLIPQNSVLFGTYNSSISYSQSRVQVAWHTLVRPDGYQVQLGSMNATDAKGASGLTGHVNDHPMAYLKAIGLMSVFSIVNSEFQSSMGNTDNEYVQNILANSQEVVTELGDKLIDRAMNVQPTIKIKSGTKINIVVNNNLTLPPCKDIPVTQAYRRVR